MRFRSLYRYSYGKSPKDLRPAIVVCKLALSLAIVAVALLLFAVSFHFYHKYHLSLESSGDTAFITTNTTANSSSSARNQAESANHSSSSSPLIRYLADYSGNLCETFCFAQIAPNSGKGLFRVREAVMEY